MADTRSATMMRAGVSRRWLMRRFHAVESLVEEEGGFILVGVLVAGGQKLWSQELQWGCCAIIFSSSRVFYVKLQGCTVLPF